MQYHDRRRREVTATEYGDYQLRYAAGMYWLLNMKQRGLSYVRPLSFNECGAHLWRLLCGGADQAELVTRLCGEYGLSREEALADVDAFLKQLDACFAADRPGVEANFEG